MAVEADKSARIVDAMRSSVAQRGVAGSTFDHVAREAGVSRGLLHYYFGTKEALLVEVCRRDCELRMQVLEQQLGGAETAEDFLERLVFALKELVHDEPEFFAVIFELFTLSRRNDEIAVEFAELMRRTREHVAGLLAVKQREGVLRLAADPEAIADVLFSLGDGVAMRMLAEPERDWGPTVAAGAEAARRLLAS
jgi:AcrR family transcriptional regulator